MGVDAKATARKAAVSVKARLDDAQTRGFALVELLALCVVFTLLSFLVLPTLVRAQQRASRATCQSNLRQIGLALQAYAALNNDSLPGPLLPLVDPRYDVRSTNQLAWFVAERTGLPRPSKARLAPIFLCPAQQTTGADESAAAASHRPNYVLNEGRGFAGRAPFGHAAEPTSAPLQLSALARAISPASFWAVADADKGDVNPTLSGWNQLPYQPIHGKVRNQLFFDWHVSAEPW